MSKIKFKQGSDVAHIDNLELKMRVRSVVFKDKKLEYIECSWFQNNFYIKEKFHSKELIPWEIASKGKEIVNSYLESLENEKKFEKIHRRI